MEVFIDGAESKAETLISRTVVLNLFLVYGTPKTEIMIETASNTIIFYIYF